jgi:hypothetical protein
MKVEQYHSIKGKKSINSFFLVGSVPISYLNLVNLKNYYPHISMESVAIPYIRYVMCVNIDFIFVKSYS